MIQTRSHFILTYNDYNSLCAKNEFYPVQKAYSTPHFIVLVVRFRGQTCYLYLGRGHHYQGVFLADKAPPPYLRLQDRLLDFMRKHVVDSRIGSLSFFDEQKYFEFALKNKSENQFLGWGYKDRQLFFLIKEDQEVFLSWSGEKATLMNWKEKLLELKIDFWDKGEESATIEAYMKHQEQKNKGSAQVKKKEKFLLKKIENIKGDLARASEWQEIQEALKMNLLDLSSDQLSIGSHTLKFGSTLTLWERRNEIFVKIKKLKKAQELLGVRLKETQLEYQQAQSGLLVVPPTKEKAIQPLWRSEKLSPLSKQSQGEISFMNIKFAHLFGTVGLNAQSNDHVRKMASANHYWFHIENSPGAHLILKTDDLSMIKPEDFALLASMLRDLSHLKMQEIPLLYTQVKNVKGIKGSAGLVSVKKPKYLRCVYRPWKEIISVN